MNVRVDGEKFKCPVKFLIPAQNVIKVVRNMIGR